MSRLKWSLSLLVATFFTLFAGLVWADTPPFLAGFLQPQPEVATDFDGSKMGAGAAGSSHTYRHLLSNHSGQAQTFTLAATSSKGFSLALSAPTVTLDDGESASVSLRVTIPTGTPPGTLDVT